MLYTCVLHMCLFKIDDTVTIRNILSIFEGKTVNIDMVAMVTIFEVFQGNCAHGNRQK